MKPLPLSPAPWVWPVKADEVEALAEWRKLEGVVEKHRKASDRKSLPG